MEIREIGRPEVGSLVRVRGELKDLKINEDGDYFFKLADETGEIRIVLFRGSGFTEKELLKEGIIAEVMGTVEMYRNNLEIIPVRNQIFIKSSHNFT